MPYPRPKPPVGGIKAPFPGFIEPELATSVDIPRQESFELLLKLIEKPVARGLLVRRLGLARARRNLRSGRMYLARKEMGAIIG